MSQLYTNPEKPTHLNKVVEPHLLYKLLSTLHQQYHRLLLIVGPHKSGKTNLLNTLNQEQSIPRLNLNLHLSQRLLEVATKHRPLRVRSILAEIIGGQPETILALDNIELLFEPTLQQDPLVVLQEMSRNKSLIVAWPGSYDELAQFLSHAQPGHPEYRRYERPEVMILTM